MKMRLMLILVAIVMLGGCASNFTVFPETPYPYDYHEKNKTCTYWLYHGYFHQDQARGHFGR
jgi:uncharacterized lipoprotein YajG